MTTTLESCSEISFEMNTIFFSPDFSAARKKFAACVRSANGDLQHIPLDATGPQGEPLGIDIAWIGCRQPRQALIHVCGIHGIEGFAGSAVQLALLDNLPDLSDDGALILVHVLNPYGMAHQRRSNANNVDLNRNFFFGTGGWRGMPDGYASLNLFLNPPSPPCRIDFFRLRLLLAKASLGSGAIRQVVAGGQYHFPKGIFFGGNGLEPEPKFYSEWLANYLGGVQDLFVIDVHTGLGNYGRQTLFLRSPAVNAEEMARALLLPIATNAIESDVMGYVHEGGHSSVYRQVLPATRTVCLTQEFGTYSGCRLLHALRVENQQHHFGDGRPGHWSKQHLKKMFCPEDQKWRQQVIKKGRDLAHRVATLLFSERYQSPSAKP
jgi:hypothetical protein